MSSIFSLRRADEDGRTAGGKITRSRRRQDTDRTPYARPNPLPSTAEEPVPESSGNPNWLSGVFRPARAVASGAGRIFSAVFGEHSSSSSSSGDDYYSEDEDDASNAADVDLNKAHSSVHTKSENVHLIHQLVMQQTFSREEGDELVKLVRSRVVQGDGDLSNAEMSGVRNSAVMEARKWLEEKKSRSSSKLKATDDEVGSPVDMAKSYMQARPTWSSPALRHVEFGTPSPMQNSKEIFHNPVQASEMKGSALSTGSWSILEEVRRVRSKATEELLTTTPSKKISFASSSLGDKSMQETIPNNFNVEKIDETLHNLTSLTPNSGPNTSLDLPATKVCRLPESLEMELDESEGGALQTNNSSLVPEQYQDAEIIPPIGDSDAANGSNPDQLDGGQLSHEMNGLKDSATKNQTLSLSAAEHTLEPCSKEKVKVDSSNEKADGTIPANSQLPNEHSNHFVDTNDQNRGLSWSQDSSSMLHEDSLHDGTQSTPNHKRKDTPLPGRKLRPRIREGKR